MIDIKKLREDPQGFKKAVARKGYKLDVDAILELDEKRRELIQELDTLRNEANKIASLGKDADREQGKELKDKIKSAEKELKQIEEELNEKLLEIPNPPLDEIPEGKDGKVIRKWGEIPEFDFKPKDHVELGEILDGIDLERAAKVSGSRFAYLKGDVALLELALIQFAFEKLTTLSVIEKIAKSVGVTARTFIPVFPPQMIRPEVFVKMARLNEEDKDERYHFTKDDLYLIGSAEHTLGAMHLDEVIEESNLPLRYVGFTTCFRREAGSYGQDVRGILRVHQFDKIEIESFTTAENSQKEHEFFIALQEHLIQFLGIPYQVRVIGAADMGRPNASQIDIEAWLPGQGKYRETHTADYMTDYQTRRLNTRVRRSNKEIELVHTNDATVFAIGRTIIAILENFQQADGSVEIPKVLHKYLSFKEIKPRTS